jgi:DNA invertase Pin-like site-specific DNA recombinase
MANEPPEEKRKTALYCRVAYPHSPDAHEIIVQQQLLRNFAKSRGFENFKEYSDIGCNGLTFDNRPAFARLEADIKAGEIETVIVRGIDRIARDFYLTARWLGGLEKHGVKFIDINGFLPPPFMSDSPSTLQ